MSILGQQNFSPELIAQLLRLVQGSQSANASAAGGLRNQLPTTGAPGNQIPANGAGGQGDMMNMLQQLLGRSSGNQFYNPYMKGPDFGSGVSDIVGRRREEIMSLLKGLL